ncbi:hypothetical protein DICVIV_01412 [Dictyocaulus viviparus]|uniref:Cadherin domain protein n=1 Tax=Dictyocaulus viviparus TaxID=29172 RepID=A0A0D8Y6S9_DICVI|nr:hypothetical protein DICVIV_01412 [Dictyocaulus viviparus]
MAVLPLSLPLIVSAITFDLIFTELKGSPLVLLSPSRNITFHISGHSLLADTEAIAKASVILTRKKMISIGNSKAKNSTRPTSVSTIQPVYVAESLEVNEGGSMPLQWKNIYILPEHSRFNISNKQILFSFQTETLRRTVEIVEGPHHGTLTLDGQPCATFDYSQLLSRSVIYKHDGSETIQDQLEFQSDLNGENIGIPWLESTTYVLKIRINPVNDPPELTEAKSSQVIKISAKGSRPLTSDHIILSDPDDGPDKACFVYVQVVENRGVHIRVRNTTVTEFTQRQFINRLVSIHDEGLTEKGVLRLIARDGNDRSQIVTLHTISTPVEVRLKANTGVRLLHHSSALITSNNLSFVATVSDLPISFSIVEVPHYGVVECSPNNGHFTVCSTFTQEQIDRGLVRFRHTSAHHPTQDTFSFQVSRKAYKPFLAYVIFLFKSLNSAEEISLSMVESGGFVSMIYNFRLMFIPMNVKVFNREVFMLNGTDKGTLSRLNLFAWTFPKSYPPEKLLYHIEEPPKYGILSRKINGKSRRIGVSSNFTQADLDNQLISFKLHFMQYSIINDFFLFRVITPAVSSESLRFEIIFVPSQTSIQLVNRTIVVHEGETTKIASDSLSLTTPDDSFFVFTLSSAPVHGSLIILTETGNKTLTTGMYFTTKDISEERLVYSHSGSESRSDKLHLVAESAFRKGRRIPFWMSFSIIPINDNPPRLRGSNMIYIVERDVVMSVKKIVYTISADYLKQVNLSCFRLEETVWNLDVNLDYFEEIAKLKSNVKNLKLVYSHSGSESRSDKLHLVAESAFRKGRRIPFWMSFSIIPINDNPPRLRGSNMIYIVERGERVLHPYLLDWIDDDSDSAPLQFNFYQPIKDAAVLSTVSPYLPITVFTDHDLQQGRIMLRHLGHKNDFIVSYTVSDQKHTVDGSLRIIASEPFVRLAENLLQYCCLPGDTPSLLVGTANLSITTNLDIRLDEIVYQTESDNFVKQHEKSRKVTRNFTQKVNVIMTIPERAQWRNGGVMVTRTPPGLVRPTDIQHGKIFYNVNIATTEALTIKVGNQSLKAELQIVRRSLGASLELRRSSTLSLPVGGVISIDSTHLEIGDAISSADDLVYHIIKQPQEGELILEQENLSSAPQLPLQRFTQRDIDLARIQYIHTANGSGRDTIQFNISSPHITKGPYSIYVEIYEHYVTVKSSLLNVVAGSSAVISSSILNVTSSDRGDYIVNIVEKPNYGWIVLDSWSINNITSIDVFSGADLRERRVVYVSDRNSAVTRDSFTVVICISQRTCTQPQIVDIIFSQRNVQSPQLLRNEILRVSAERTPITNAHLDTEDPDTPSNSVFFLISRPSKGIVVNVNDLSKAIYNFSQKDIDDLSVVFIRHDSEIFALKHTSGSGGFSFLLSDGAHQLGPEWFSIESWTSTSPVLQTNAKLLASPSASTVIGVDSLRANIPNTRPEEILYSVSSPPKYGKLIVDSHESDKFSQLDINQKSCRL